jgi:hypothetical protein
MPSQQFLKDRRRGERGQHYVAEMFRSWGLYVWEVPRGHFPGFDIRAWGTLRGIKVDFTAEVKDDYRFATSGNLALELEALSHSKASILCFYTEAPDPAVYMMPLQNALEIALAWPDKRITGEHGEVSAIVPEYELMSRCKQIQKLTTKPIGLEVSTKVQKEGLQAL